VIVLRSILALALGLSMIVSSAPASPSLSPASDSVEHACCKHHKSAPAREDSKSPCHDESCAMQCCRLLPVQADSRPILEPTFQVVRAEPMALVTLHTLTDPPAIFHPPNA
jgi:hypothetical protein